MFVAFDLKNPFPAVSHDELDVTVSRRFDDELDERSDRQRHRESRVAVRTTGGRELCMKIGSGTTPGDKVGPGMSVQSTNTRVQHVVDLTRGPFIA